MDPTVGVEPGGRGRERREDLVGDGVGEHRELARRAERRVGEVRDARGRGAAAPARRRRARSCRSWTRTTSSSAADSATASAKTRLMARYASQASCERGIEHGLTRGVEQAVEAEPEDLVGDRRRSGAGALPDRAPGARPPARGPTRRRPSTASRSSSPIAAAIQVASSRFAQQRGECADDTTGAALGGERSVVGTSEARRDRGGRRRSPAQSDSDVKSPTQSSSSRGREEVATDVLAPGGALAVGAVGILQQIE